MQRCLWRSLGCCRAVAGPRTLYLGFEDVGTPCSLAIEQIEELKVRWIGGRAQFVLLEAELVKCKAVDTRLSGSRPAALGWVVWAILGAEAADGLPAVR